MALWVMLLRVTSVGKLRAARGPRKSFVLICDINKIYCRIKNSERLWLSFRFSRSLRFEIIQFGLPVLGTMSSEHKPCHECLRRRGGNSRRSPPRYAAWWGDWPILSVRKEFKSENFA